MPLFVSLKHAHLGDNFRAALVNPRRDLFAAIRRLSQRLCDIFSLTSRTGGFQPPSGKNKRLSDAPTRIDSPLLRTCFGYQERVEVEVVSLPKSSKNPR